MFINNVYYCQHLCYIVKTNFNQNDKTKYLPQEYQLNKKNTPQTTLQRSLRKQYNQFDKRTVERTHL